MKRLVALGVSIILSAELAALALHDRRFVLFRVGGGRAQRVFSTDALALNNAPKDLGGADSNDATGAIGAASRPT